MPTKLDTIIAALQAAGYDLHESVINPDRRYITGWACETERDWDDALQDVAAIIAPLGGRAEWIDDDLHVISNTDIAPPAREGEQRTVDPAMTAAAAAMGRRGGSSRSEAKAAAARANGRRGGRKPATSTINRNAGTDDAYAVVVALRDDGYYWRHDSEYAQDGCAWHGPWSSLEDALEAEAKS